ncbi:MAG TPA: hypothetical protein VGF75_06670 [Candidatus Saccharimonadales bacterium]
MFRKMPKWLAFIILEGWPIIVVVLAVIIELSHIVTSGWASIYLYNGDSLTLPFLREALSQHHQFLWVSSSQLLVFPEGLLYLVSCLIGHSVRASLAINSVVNVAALYLIFRWLIGLVGNYRLRLKQTFALGCVLLLVLYMLLERQPLVNMSSIATLYIFNDYYYGIIVSGGILLCLMLSLKGNVNSLKSLSKQQILLLSLSVLLAALTTFSNPIFIVQFLAPILITLCLVWLLGGIRFKHGLLLAVPLIIGTGIGYLARSPLKKVIGQSLTNHIDVGQIPPTLKLFHQSFRQDLTSKSGLLELILIVLTNLFCIFYSAWWVYQKTHHKKKNLEYRFLLLSLFGFISALAVIVFSVAIGSLSTRYMLPLVIFPLFSLIPLFIYINKHLYKAMVVTSLVVIVFVVIYGLFSINQATKIVSSSNYTYTSCLSRALDYKAANGVGTYWDVRSLDLYGLPNEQAVQVTSQFTDFPWQANLGDYAAKNFSFVVVDKNNVTNPTGITPNDTFLPSNPANIYACGMFYVYQYSPGSSGYNTLNSDVHTSYVNELKLRSMGMLSQQLD